MTLAVHVGYAERCFQDLPPCGDGMKCLQQDHILRLMLADGIGHGAHAHRVVSQLSERFAWIYGRIGAHSGAMTGIADCMRELHGLLSGQQQTDQAAVAMLEMNTQTGLINALSVGNVRVHSVGAAGCFSFPCLNGMVGGHLPRQLTLTVRQAEEASLLVLHSDGLGGQAVVSWLENRQGRFSPVAAGSAQQTAEALLQHCAKRSDDAACAVVIVQGSPA